MAETIHELRIVAPANVLVDWGDGSPPERVVARRNNDKFIQHTYSLSGEYVISITGRMSELRVVNEPLLTEVISFGNTEANSLKFNNCQNLVGVPATLPPTITTLASAFSDCPKFNDPKISNWNTENVKNFNATFSDCSTFNQPLNWDTSNGVHMNSMLARCSQFNQSINQLSFAEAVNADRFLLNALAFNQPIDGLSFPKAQDLSYFLGGCSSFNSDITNCDTSYVKYWDYFFNGCSVFNKPLTGLDFSGSETMRFFLASAQAFNQPLEQMQTQNVTNFTDFLNGAIKFNQPMANFKMQNAGSSGMRRFFQFCTDFNQNISSWVTPLITSAPTNFSFLSGLSAENLPRWGR